MCLIPLALVNVANSSDVHVNCIPLTDTDCSGCQYCANNCCSTSMVFSEVVVLISITSGHFKCPLTRI